MRILSINYLKNDLLLMCESMRTAKQNTFNIETNMSEHFLVHQSFTAFFLSWFHKSN